MLCKAAARDYIVLPCNHNAICSKCAPKTTICPFCKGNITGGKARVQTVDESDMILAGLKKEEAARVRMRSKLTRIEKKAWKPVT